MDAAWSRPFVAWPRRDSPVSLATWLREVVEFVRMRGAQVPYPADAPRGQGEPVIVVPAFLSPDSSTASLRAFLAHQGFEPECWNCGMNLGPMRRAVVQLDHRVREIAQRHRRKVSLVGISLGGTLAREAAKRCRECVARVVTLASPINMPVVTPLAPFARLAATFWDGTAEAAFEHIAEAPPVPLTAIVSHTDGVVDWRACMPQPARGVETVLISGAHMTIAANAEALRVVAARLAGRPHGPGA
ncbi:MAG: alpha/beta hydrolase [Rhizomicrobium sp.]